MTTIRWGIIGCGNVTEVKSGPAFQKAGGSELTAVMRRNGALAQDYAERHGVAAWYSDADELIGSPEVDAVYIATPPAFHKTYTLAAARAGKPVYVEKPMAMNEQECKEMVRACEEAGVPLFVAYYRRALPRFLKIKQLLEDGRIGDIRYVTTMHTAQVRSGHGDRAFWRVQPEIAGGGLFLDLASHTLDILDFLLGPIAEACGKASNRAGQYKAEDMVAGTYLFESGIQGTGMWCFCAHQNEDRNEIVGSKGFISFATFGDGPIVWKHDGKTEVVPVADNPRHIQQPLIQTIVDELRGNGSCPSTGVSGIRTNRVMDALIRNFYGR